MAKVELGLALLDDPDGGIILRLAQIDADSEHRSASPDPAVVALLLRAIPNVADYLRRRDVPARAPTA